MEGNLNFGYGENVRKVPRNFEFGPHSDLWRSEIANRTLDGLDLRGIRLSGSELRSISFRGANLTGANFSYSNLKDIDFTGADLTGADFFQSQVSNSNFLGANIAHASFEELDWVATKHLVANYVGWRENDDVVGKKKKANYLKLTKPNLSELLPGAELRFVNLDNQNLTGFDLNSIDFRGSSFVGAKMANCNLKYTRLAYCDFANVDFSGTDFTNSNAENTNFSNASLRDTLLVGTNLSGANLEKSKLNKSKLHGSDLSYTDFRKSSLFRAEIRDVYLGATHCPHNQNLRKCRRCRFRKAFTSTSFKKGNWTENFYGLSPDGIAAEEWEDIFFL